LQVPPLFCAEEEDGENEVFSTGAESELIRINRRVKRG
jgi:hypothetical protein